MASRQVGVINGKLNFLKRSSVVIGAEGGKVASFIEMTGEIGKEGRTWQATWIVELAKTDSEALSEAIEKMNAAIEDIGRRSHRAFTHSVFCLFKDVEMGYKTATGRKWTAYLKCKRGDYTMELEFEEPNDFNDFLDGVNLALHGG